MSPAPLVSPVSGLEQAVDAGVFGLGEEDWKKSGNADVQQDGSLEITLEDESVITVRLDEDDKTTFVGYRLPDPLSFPDGERFVVQELLPSDAEFVGQYDDILPGRPDGEVTVRLYESQNLRGYPANNSGIVLFAWHEDGTTFSVSIGNQP
jgi:hypothetical protein